jgi:hypothetical protein
MRRDYLEVSSSDSLRHFEGEKSWQGKINKKLIEADTKYFRNLTQKRQKKMLKTVKQMVRKKGEKWSKKEDTYFFSIFQKLFFFVADVVAY